ncbi:MAG: hypothetical protein Q7T51_03125 [Candidatus Moranbacteria bacterium]|nr:hypothetical protein [Candidatus Moranbacteria bacterium]
MGILFNRKSAAGFTTNKKFLAANELHRKDIKEISRNVGIHKIAGQHEFKKMLTESRHGGVTRDEIHDNLQKLIGEGYIKTTSQARGIASDLGLKGRSLLKFKNLHNYLRSERAVVGKSVEMTGGNNEALHKEVVSNNNHPAIKSNLGPIIPEKKIVQPSAPTNLQFKSFQNPSVGMTEGFEVSNGRPKSVWDILNKSRVHESEDETNS